MCSEWIAPSRRSSSSAFSFKSSTAARLSVQTLIGSYVALSTSTRAILPANSTHARAGNSVGRVGAEDPHRFGLAAKRLDRLGDDLLRETALEVAKEHVPAETLAQRARLDPTEVD